MKKKHLTLKEKRASKKKIRLDNDEITMIYDSLYALRHVCFSKQDLRVSLTLKFKSLMKKRRRPKVILIQETEKIFRCGACKMEMKSMIDKLAFDCPYCTEGMMIVDDEVKP